MRFVVWAALLAGCAELEVSPDSATDASTQPDSAVVIDAGPIRPAGPASTGVLCERAGDDLMRDLFCSLRPPIGSLADLQGALAIDPTSSDVDRSVSIAGHSTALSTRSVSAVNPRVIFVRGAREPDEMLSLAFVRGEQTVELVVRDRATRELRFYLVTYRQACNDAPEGCRPGDLLTPETERGWRDVALLEEEDLKNTVLDCRQCHQPDGPGTPKLLRMQELDLPWTHWFDLQLPGGMALMQDYFAMKGDEPLAGMPASRIAYAQAAPLAGFVRDEGRRLDQPNEFAAMRIEAEVKASAPGQPFDNSVPGRSATWRALYEVAKRGDAINVPYHDVKVTDPQKLASATAAYQSYLRGELPAAELPDFRDIYPDDPQILAELGFATEPGLDGEGVLRQACYQCHNPRLDQTIGRARFVADLGKLGREQRDLAIERVMLPPDDPRVMPPSRLRVLSDEARERLIGVLRE